MSAPESGLARAALRAAMASGETERVLNELGQVQALLLPHKGYFFSPLISAKEQEALLRDILRTEACGLTVEFLALLARKRKMKLLPAIVRRYEELAKKELGLVDVRLRAPFAPSDSLLQKFRDYFAECGLLTEAQKDTARIHVIEDKSLLGGFVAECGGWVLDKSLRSKLNQLAIYRR